MVLREETLDPTDWQEFRGLAHRMVDDILTYQQTVRQRPVWQPIPEQVEMKFQEPVPRSGQPEAEVYEEFRRYILPYPAGNLHPRWWGWVLGTGTPLGALSDMLAAGMNSPMGFASASNRLEQQVVDWCKQMLHYPEKASGLLVSGCSMANLTGLAVARDNKAGFDVRKQGLGGRHRRMVLYGSREMHNSITRAVELLGFGSDALTSIPTDDSFRIDVDKLRAAIRADLRAGAKPICVIGTAGTTNTGSMDPLEELAEIASEHGLWFHVDGAFGAFAYLSEETRPLVKGMDRADSLAFDLHKWGYLPFAVACVLVRDAEAHRRTFATKAAYLKHYTRGTAAGRYGSEYGLELSRGFRALKVWMSLKAHGVEKLSRMIQQNVDQANYLASLIKDSKNLELMAPVGLNVVCFRFKESRLGDQKLDSLNEELMLRLQESGTAVVSGTELNGRFVMRCAITNHRSVRKDFELLASEVERLGNELINSWPDL
jgi:aromatic-L-amino-acid/L-tryptophan decarboxylase